MSIVQLSPRYEDDYATAISCGVGDYITVKPWAIVSDHIHHDEKETIYLLEGTVRYTIGNETSVLIGPAKVVIEPWVYHKGEVLSEARAFEIKEKV